MDRSEAVTLVNRLSEMCARSWGDEKIKTWVRHLEQNTLPYRHVSGTLERMFEEHDPDKITLPKLIEETKKYALATWIPRLEGPERDPFEPIPWREPDPKNMPNLPLERPDPEFRKAYREWANRTREDAAIYLRKQRQDRIQRGVSMRGEMRSILMRIASHWIRDGRPCAFCGGLLTVESLGEYVDWAMDGPREGTDDRVFCNECAPRAIEQIDARIRA